MQLSLKQWRQRATPAQLKALAKYAKTSRTVLSHLVSGFRGGSAAAAIRISAAAAKVKDGPGSIDQASICPSCKSCRFYKGE